MLWMGCGVVSYQDSAGPQVDQLILHEAGPLDTRRQRILQTQTQGDNEGASVACRSSCVKKS